MKNNFQPIHILERLIAREDLTSSETAQLLRAVISKKIPASLCGALLTALRMKGESCEEFIGGVQLMRQYMQKVSTSGVVVDTCGTGGDGMNSFNISTMVAFVVAGASVPVAKHGNRGISSQSGSADVLEALGMHIMLSPRQAERLLKKTNFTFLFAPLFHPVMQEIKEIRKDLGIRTIFNLFGPFINPAGVKRQLIGVASDKLFQRLAGAVSKLSYQHLLLVHSDDGFDEITTTGVTHVVEVKGSHVRTYDIHPRMYGMKQAKSDDLIGGSVDANAHITREILAGKSGPRHDVVVLNAGAALYVSGAVSSIAYGIAKARESILSGRAQKVLQQVITDSQRI